MDHRRKMRDRKPKRMTAAERKKGAIAQLHDAQQLRQKLVVVQLGQQSQQSSQVKHLHLLVLRLRLNLLIGPC